LPRAGRDASQQAATLEEIIELRVQLAVLAAILELLQHSLALLDLLVIGGSMGSILLLPLAQADTVVCRIPGLKWSGIHLNDGVLHQSLGAHQLVIGGIVHHIKNTGLVCGCLASPAEVSSIQAHGAELEVPTTASHNMDALSANPRRCWRASQQKFPLLADRLPLTTGVAALVLRVT